MIRSMPDQPLAKCVQESNVEMLSTLRVDRGDRAGTLSISGPGHTCSSAGRICRGTELALGVLVHDPGEC